MADENVNIKIDFETNTSDLNKVGKEIDSQITSMKSLKAAYKAALDEAASGSEEATKRAGELKDQIEDTKKAVNGFNGDPVENLSRGFGNLKNTLVNLDFKGFTEEVNRLKSISKGLSFGELVSSVKDTAKAFISLGQVLLTNPIFLIAAAVAGIIAALAYFSSKSAKEAKEASDNLTKSFEAQKEALDAVRSSQDKVNAAELKLAKAYGASAAELNKLTLEQSYLASARAKADLSANELFLSQKRQLYVKASDEDKAAIAAEIKGIENKSLELKTILKTEALDRITTNKEYLNKIVTDATKAENDKLKAKKDAQDKEDGIQKDQEKKSQDALDKLKAANTKFAEDNALIPISAQKFVDTQLDESQKKNNTYADERIAKSGQEAAAKIANSELTADADERAAARKAAAEKAAYDQTISTAQASTDSLIALNDLVYNLRSNNLKKGSAAERKAARQQFNINKALAISQTVISTIQGITNALSAQSIVPDPYGTILKVATAVAVGVAGTANTIKIASQKFNDSGSDSGGGGGSATTVPAIATNAAANPAQINNSAAGINTGNTVGNGNRTNITTQPQKVYVTQTDIADQNKKVEVIQNRASY